MADDKKKNIFDKAIDALTNRDEKEAMEKAQREAEAARKEASMMKAKMEVEKAAAAKAAAEKAASEKAAAEKAASEKAAAQREAAKVLAERAAAERELAAQQAAKKPRKATVNVKSLRIRKEHNTTSEVVAGLVFGDEVSVLETWTDGKDTWAKIGEGRWAAMIYNGETYIKYAD